MIYSDYKYGTQQTEIVRESSREKWEEEKMQQYFSDTLLTNFALFINGVNPFSYAVDPKAEVDCWLSILLLFFIITI